MDALTIWVQSTHAQRYQDSLRAYQYRQVHEAEREEARNKRRRKQDGEEHKVRQRKIALLRKRMLEHNEGKVCCLNTLSWMLLHVLDARCATLRCSDNRACSTQQLSSRDKLNCCTLLLSICAMTTHFHSLLVL
jgi:hypothetical protein